MKFGDDKVRESEVNAKLNNKFDMIMTKFDILHQARKKPVWYVKVNISI